MPPLGSRSWGWKVLAAGGNPCLASAAVSGLVTGVFSGIAAIVVRTRLSRFLKLSWFSLKRELAFPVSEYTAIAGRDFNDS